MIKEKTKFLFYTLTHPVDAFYEIRHREKTTSKSCLLF